VSDGQVRAFYNVCKQCRCHDVAVFQHEDTYKPKGILVRSL
jgi:hypothetical protein